MESLIVDFIYKLFIEKYTFNDVETYFSFPDPQISA